MFRARCRRLSAFRRCRRPGSVAFAALLAPFAAPCQPALDGAAATEEVIVTARKLREDLSRVPMSVQALSGDFLERRDLASLYDLQFEIPGLVVTNSGMFGAGIALRGVTDEGGGSLAVAPHVNGVYLGRSGLALARLFDVERVEVVKGPQGTLYGRNATGGSINMVTRAPVEEFGAAVEGAFGSFDTKRIEGHVNIPAEKLAVRLAVAGSEGDGFIRNSVDERTFGEEDYVGIRASVRARPTAALSIDVRAERVQDGGGRGELWLPRKDHLPDPNDIRLTTVTLDDPYLRLANELGAVDLAYALGDMTLRSITGYARSTTRAVDDCAGVPLLQGCVRSVQPFRYEQRSQELRLESAATSPTWLLGAFFLDAEETTNFRFSAPRLAPGAINDYSATLEETAYALFGQASREIGERWSANGGLRFSREVHRAADVGSGIADHRTPAFAEGSWNDRSWRLGLEFSPTERMLLYASVATGFKSGGITTELLPNGVFDDFGPENLLAYEVGISASAPGGRWTLRASAFSYDFEDMQVRTTVVLENRVASVVDNAAAARIQGLDMSATRSFADRFRISGALVWMPRREFVEFVDELSGDSISGNTLSRAPEWSASASLGYRAPIRGIGEFSADVNYSYRSELFFTKDNDPILAQGDVGLLNAVLRLGSADDRWYVFASGGNLLDTDYFTQVFLQSSPGYPANYELGFGLRR